MELQPILVPVQQAERAAEVPARYFVAQRPATDVGSEGIDLLRLRLGGRRP